MERELEGERARKRTAEREINEINLQINHKRMSGTAGASTESSRMQFLREEIAKKQVQISTVQREYKSLLEQRTESVLNSSNAHVQGSPPPRSAAADQANMHKLEEEMTEIKAMLNEYGMRNKN